MLYAPSVLLFIQFLHVFSFYNARARGHQVKLSNIPNVQSNLQDLLPLNITEAKSINYSINLFFNLGLIHGSSVN